MLSRRRLVQLMGGAPALAAAGPAMAQALDWDLPELRTLQVNGEDIAYFEAGAGRPLVLAHGMSGSAAMEWGRVMRPLARRFRVIAPYQIGFAPSSQPDLAYDASIF